MVLVGPRFVLLVLAHFRLFDLRVCVRGFL